MVVMVKTWKMVMAHLKGGKDPPNLRNGSLKRIRIDESVQTQVNVQNLNQELTLMGTKDTKKIANVEMNFVEIMVCIDAVCTCELGNGREGRVHRESQRSG